jgi:RNA polymerase sigma factor (sigma-70 family)
MDDRRERFEALFRANSPLILAYALRRTDEPADAADVVSETFLVAWRRLDDVPTGDRARLCLYGTARKVLANHHRGHRRARRLSERVAHHLPTLVEAVHDAAISDDSDRAAIAAAFGRLKDDDRDVLFLVGVEELDRDEAAEVLGCSRSNLRLRLHRARRRFAAELRTEGIDPKRSPAPGQDTGRRASARPETEEAL